MKIKHKSTYVLIELETDELKTTIFKSDQDEIHNVQTMISKIENEQINY